MKPNIKETFFQYLVINFNGKESVKDYITAPLCLYQK